MSLQNTRLNMIELMNVDVSAGGTATATKLNTVVGRPNGKYAMVVALYMIISYTATETGAATFTAEEMYQVVSGLTLKHSGVTRFNNYSGFSLMRRAVQFGEFFSPEQFAAWADVSDVTATGSVTTKFFIPLAFGWQRSRDLRGGIPLSELANGELSVATKSNPVEVTTASTNYFDAGTITVKVYAEVEELDAPVDVLFVEESETVEAGSREQVAGSGERRYAYLAIADDVDSALTDLTQPTAFSISIDGATYATNQIGARYVDRVDVRRQDGVNDILPDICPIFSLDACNFNVDNMPLVKDKLILENAGSAHSGSHKTICGYLYRPTRDKLREVWTRWQVPEAIISSYFSELDAPSGDASVAHTREGVPFTHIDSGRTAANAIAVLKA